MTNQTENQTPKGWRARYLKPELGNRTFEAGNSLLLQSTIRHVSTSGEAEWLREGEPESANGFKSVADATRFTIKRIRGNKTLCLALTDDGKVYIRTSKKSLFNLNLRPGEWAPLDFPARETITYFTLPNDEDNALLVSESGVVYALGDITDEPFAQLLKKATKVVGPQVRLFYFLFVFVFVTRFLFLFFPFFFFSFFLKYLEFIFSGRLQVKERKPCGPGFICLWQNRLPAKGLKKTKQKAKGKALNKKPKK